MSKVEFPDLMVERTDTQKWFHRKVSFEMRFDLAIAVVDTLGRIIAQQNIIGLSVKHVANIQRVHYVLKTRLDEYSKEDFNLEDVVTVKKVNPNYKKRIRYRIGRVFRLIGHFIDCGNLPKKR